MCSNQWGRYAPIRSRNKIPKKTFESYRDKFDKVTREIADKWYRFDSNTNCYVLENLVDLNDKEYWDKVLPTLVKALDNCEFDPAQYPGAHVGRSVTEWEVTQILQKTEYLCRSLWVQRDWDNEGAELNAEELKLFEKFYSVGKNEVATREKLEALKQAMQAFFSHDPSRHIKMKIPWRNYKSDTDGNDKKAEFLSEWTLMIQGKLEESLNEMVAKFKRWSLNAIVFGCIFPAIKWCPTFT